MKPYMMSLTEAAAAIQRGELTPKMLAESLLERITDIEPMIHAWVTIDREKVLKEAEKAETNSRLHGVPIGIKDIYYTAGMRTTMGSPIFNDFIPETDAWIVKRIKEEG
ncbi:hypothetical protein E4H04_01010, partial [Candidatus Bathyarchaeota archaeon]